MLTVRRAGMLCSTAMAMLVTVASVNADIRTTAGYSRIVVDGKFQGKPFTFTYLSSCQVRESRSLLTGRSYDGNVYPPIYGYSPDGRHVIAVLTPAICKGQTTANHKIPDRFMPFIVVFNDMDKPYEAIGYVTEDAYASAKAIITNINYSVFASNKDEFDESLKYPYNEILKMNSNAAKPFISLCSSYTKIEMSLEKKADASTVPHNGAWYPSDPDTANRMANLVGTGILHSDTPTSIPHKWTEYNVFGNASPTGMPSRAGGNTLNVGPIFAGAEYPAIPFYSFINTPLDRNTAYTAYNNDPDWIYDTDKTDMGFSYCYVDKYKAFSREDAYYLGNYNNKKHHTDVLIDGRIVSAPGLAYVPIFYGNDYVMYPRLMTIPKM